MALIWDIYSHLLADAQAGVVLGLVLLFVFPVKGT